MAMKMSHAMRCVVGRRSFSLFAHSPKIVFEDNDFFFVTKASGTPTLGLSTGPGSDQPCFLDAVRELAKSQFRFSPDAILPLDRVASGLMVFAKHAAAERHLKQLVSNSSVALEARWAIIEAKERDRTPSPQEYTRAALPTVSQSFVAFVRGAPQKERGKLDCGVLRRTGTNRSLMVRRGGMPTRTNYAVVTAAPQRYPALDLHWNLTLPRAKADKAENPEADRKFRPSTGVRIAQEERALSLMVFRTATHERHQVRAACSWLGTPIVGDKDYGGGEAPVTLMHSALLEMPSMDGRQRYAICDAPAHWTAYGLPDCTKLVSSLGDTTAGPLRSVFERSQPLKPAAPVSSATKVMPQINAARLATAAAGFLPKL